MKAPAKAAKSQNTPETKRALRARTHRTEDILGVVCLAAGVFLAVALASSNAGIVGAGLNSLLSYILGRGAWALPIAGCLIGIGLLRGKPVAVQHLAWGLVLLTAAFLASVAQTRNGDYFDPSVVSVSGGILGAFLGWALHAMMGSAASIAAATMAVVGVILMVDVPIRDMIARAQKGASDAGKKAKSTVAAVVQKRAEGRPAKELNYDAPAFLNKAKRIKEPEPAEEPPFDARAAAEAEAVVVAPKPEPAKPPTRRLAPVAKEKIEEAPALPLDLPVPKEGYQLPPITLLAERKPGQERSPSEIQRNIETLESTLEEFGIESTVVEVAAGPTVTRYEIQLGRGVKVSRITALADNIAMNLAASQVRVEAPIPGKAAIGVEVPNETPTMVTLRELCESKEFMGHPSHLYIALGKDVSGALKYADLTKMPHLLIGGATNSGKSIGLATLITSLLMRNTPRELRLVMIDPKRVELTLFDNIPHLMCPVIKDVKEAAGVLRALWREMDRRFDLFSESGVRNIASWNEKVSVAEKLPYIVVIIDELADLMIQCGAEVETVIVRLAQLARAVGIHLVIATQRPSVDVITGLIKANIPSRIAFSVASQIDSRTILDAKGAENLIGKGDMLYNPIESQKPTRIQGCYVSEKEIDDICRFWRAQQAPEYTLVPVESPGEVGPAAGKIDDEEMDALWEDAVRWVVERGQASTSMIQRRFSIGFQRASRLLDLMEERGIVGPRDGPRPRDVMVNILEVDAIFGKVETYQIGGTLDDDIPPPDPDFFDESDEEGKA